MYAKVPREWKVLCKYEVLLPNIHSFHKHTFCQELCWGWKARDERCNLFSRSSSFSGGDRQKIEGF